jgi:DNA helicase-2/ATP-dependent DNA helicase PcrA
MTSHHRVSRRQFLHAVALASATAPSFIRNLRAASPNSTLRHASFGDGTITHLFGSGEKISIAVKFEGMGPKILDPRLAPIEPL